MANVIYDWDRLGVRDVVNKQGGIGTEAGGTYQHAAGPTRYDFLLRTPSDTSSEDIHLTLASTAGTHAGVMLFASSPSSILGYTATIDRKGTDQIYLGKLTSGGAFTTLAQAAIPLTVDDRWRFTASTDGAASTLRIYRWDGGGWVEALAATDGNAPHIKGRAGLVTFSPNAPTTFGPVEIDFAYPNEVAAPPATQSYLLAGQSNMTGRGTNSQSYSHPTLTAANFRPDYTWRQLVDPWAAPGGVLDAPINDPSAAGSMVPHFAQQMLDTLRQEIGVVSATKSGTSLPEWAKGSSDFDRSTLYGAMQNRAREAGGVAAVLWWQGENDAFNQADASTHQQRLENFADDVWSDLQAPLVVARLQQCTAAPAGSIAAINAGIDAAVANHAHILPGPDLSDLVTDDGYHLLSDAKLATAGRRWAAALINWMLNQTSSNIISQLRSGAVDDVDFRGVLKPGLLKTDGTLKPSVRSASSHFAG